MFGLIFSLSGCISNDTKKLVYGSSQTSYSATLYPVTDGNAQTDFVSEADFPK